MNGYKMWLVVVRGKGTVVHFDVWAISAEAAIADVMQACFEPEIIQVISR